MSIGISLEQFVPRFRTKGDTASDSGETFTRIPSSPQITSPTFQPNIGSSTAESTEDRGSEGGLHGILKSTDYWFNYELSLLEREARESAESHARAGLPRQDVPVVDELDAENVLRKKASQLFDQWADRVRRKLHDAIQEACVSARSNIGHLRYTAECLEQDANNSKEQERELLSIQTENTNPKPPLEYGRMLGRVTYLVLAALLVVVDWVANVPIFRELLPQEPGSALAWDNLVSGSERYGLFAGIVRLFDRICFSPEVSILALGVIVFLMFLGHVTGMSLRRLVAFRPKDEPSADFQLRSHSRQSMIPLVASLAGIVLVLSFLFISRYKLDHVTETRKAAAARHVDELKEKVEKDTDNFDALRLDKRNLTDAQTELDERTSSADYASGISEMNWPIFLLNTTLVITAAAGSYLESTSKVLPNHIGDPRLPYTQQSIRALGQKIVEGRARIRDLDSEVKTNLGRARYLANSNPFVDWEAKAARLDGIIPLFRSSNACLRGLDTSNIRAFDRRKPLDLVPPCQGESFRVPEEMNGLEREYGEVSSYVTKAMAKTVVSNDGGEQ